MGLRLDVVVYIFLPPWFGLSILCSYSQVAVGGARSKDFFDRYGDLKRIRRLKYWSLDKLLIDKYEFSEEDARGFAEFLCPLLDFAPEKRPTAQQCLQHPWLNNLSSPTPSATKNESNVEKVNIGMSNLRVTVGKWRNEIYWFWLHIWLYWLWFILFVTLLIRFIFWLTIYIYKM